MIKPLANALATKVVVACWMARGVDGTMFPIVGLQANRAITFSLSLSPYTESVIASCLKVTSASLQLDPHQASLRLTKAPYST